MEQISIKLAVQKNFQANIEMSAVEFWKCFKKFIKLVSVVEITYIWTFSNKTNEHWVSPRTQWRPLRKALIRWLVADACLWLSPP